MYDLALGDTERDCSLLCVTIDGIHRATFFLKCSIRPSATPTIVLLRRRGIRVHMITGDHHGAAYTLTGPALITVREQVQAIAEALGEPSSMLTPGPQSHCRPSALSYTLTISSPVALTMRRESNIIEVTGWSYAKAS